LTHAIRSAVRSRVLDVPHTHRALVFLPRSVVESLLSERPQLVGPAAVAFVDRASSSPPSSAALAASQDVALGSSLLASKSSALLDCCAEEWVWATFVFGRTHYAMLRQFCSPAWPVSDSVPGRFVEWLASRQQQQQSTSNLLAALRQLPALPPHARHAICVGVRLLVGLCQFSQEEDSSAKSTLRRSSNERTELQCELERWFSDRPSRPGRELERSHEALIPEPPSAEHADNEDWMNITEEEMRRLTKGSLISSASRPGETSQTAKTPASALDDVLGGVKSFLGGTSDAFGVDTAGAAASRARGPPPPAPSTDDAPARFVVDPVVVLNLLHATLKAPTADELVLPLQHADADPQPTAESDPYFSEQDYQDLIMDGEDDDGSSTSSLSHFDEHEEAAAASDDPDDAGMPGLMRAMDLELDRAMDVTDDDLRNADPETVESMHLLSNLMKSLESSSGPGSAGPLQNMLKEMGIEPPDFGSPSV
jgi:hypothetical protein